MSKKKQKTNTQSQQQSAGAQNSTGVDTDGTREYRLHSYNQQKSSENDPKRAANPGDPEPWTPMDNGPSGLGALNHSVYEGLRDEEFYPGLAQSGQVPQRTRDGSLGEEDSVVDREVVNREEYPYG